MGFPQRRPSDIALLDDDEIPTVRQGDDAWFARDLSRFFRGLVVVASYLCKDTSPTFATEQRFWEIFAGLRCWWLIKGDADLSRHFVAPAFVVWRSEPMAMIHGAKSAQDQLQLFCHKCLGEALRPRKLR